MSNAQLLKILEEELKLPGNGFCVDCGQKTPKWSSTNLGVYMCMNCSGSHRHIGTAYSKVKSTNMDHWSPEQVNFMRTLGNTKANRFWEALIPPDIRRPQEIDERHKFIANKYVRRLWVDPDAPVPYQYAPLFPGRAIASIDEVQVPIPASSPSPITSPVSPSISPINVVHSSSSPTPGSGGYGSNTLFSIPPPTNPNPTPPIQLIPHPQAQPVVDNSMPDLLSLGQPTKPAIVPYDLTREIFGTAAPPTGPGAGYGAARPYGSPPPAVGGYGAPVTTPPFGSPPPAFGSPVGYGRGGGGPLGYPGAPAPGYGQPGVGAGAYGYGQRPIGTQPGDIDLLDLGGKNKPAITVEQSSAILSMFEPQRGNPAPPQPAYGGYSYNNPTVNPVQNLFGPSPANPWG